MARVCSSKFVSTSRLRIHKIQSRSFAHISIGAVMLPPQAPVRASAAATHCRLIRLKSALMNHVDGFLGHGIKRGHRLGIGLEGALGDDQV